MVGKTRISNVGAVLNAIRLQIVLLQKADERNPYNKEVRKRLREAETQESEILAKLREWTMN